MKTKPVVLAAFVAAFVLSAQSLFADPVFPAGVQAERRNLQQRHSAVGVGVSDFPNVTAARNAAILLARGEIAQEIEAVVRLAQDFHLQAFQVGNCRWTEIFFEHIATSLSEASFRGSRPVHEERNGREYWAMVEMPRENVVAHIESVVPAALAAVDEAIAADPVAPPRSALELGRLSADDALMRMNAAFEQHFRNNN